MFKKLLFSAFMVGFALTANAQIATPRLDNGFRSYGAAAAGWRYNSAISFTSVTAEGKAELDDEEEGDVKTGLPATGPDDGGSIPFMLAAYRGETWGAELYTNFTNGESMDVEMDIDVASGVEEFNMYKEHKERRLNFAYVVGETVSVGLGYSSVILQTKKEIAGSNYLLNTSPTPVYGSLDREETSKVTTNSMGLSASVRLAEIFFIALGMENVTETGTFESETVSVISGVGTTTSTVGTDYVDNGWTNTMFGLGLIYGQPDDTQFRIEYAAISSPESEEEADGDKVASEHPATITTSATLEVKWNDILITYQNERKKEDELNDVDTETVTTMMGLGWQPMEGLAVSLYSYNKEVTMNNSLGEIKLKPSGFRLSFGYNF